jgi:hypothetical protein
MFQSLSPLDKEWVIKGSNFSCFCMMYAAVTECYGKGTDSKLACPVERDKKHAKNYMTS